MKVEALETLALTKRVLRGRSGSPTHPAVGFQVGWQSTCSVGAALWTRRSDFGVAVLERSLRLL